MTPNPHNEEAERACLACYLKQPALLDSAPLPDAAFYTPQSLAMWQAMKQCGSALDAVTLNNELGNSGLLDAVGGPAAVAHLMNEVPTIGLFSHYKGIVLDLLKRRQMIALSEELATNARNMDVPVSEASAHADSAVTRLCTDTQPAALDLRALCLAAGERYEKYHEGDGALPGVPLGIPKVDAALGGLRAGEVMVIGARPGYGKTSLLLDITRHAASQGFPVGVFSAEMPGAMLIDRLVAQQGRISGNPIRGTRQFSRMELQKLGPALNEISNLPLHIDDSPALDTAQLRARARAWKREHGIKMIVADYLQLFKSAECSRHASKTEKVQDVSACFRELAKELEVPLVVLAQLSRDADKLKAEEMNMGLVQWSSGIEQDATICAVLGEPGDLPVTVEEETEHFKVLDFVFLKSRNVGKLSTWLRFWKEETHFEELEV